MSTLGKEGLQTWNLKMVNLSSMKPRWISEHQQSEHIKFYEAAARSTLSNRGLTLVGLQIMIKDIMQ